jgi:thiosulfate/3-mercaptopyruvate sulfurtransferase
MSVMQVKRLSHIQVSVAAVILAFGTFMIGAHNYRTVRAASQAAASDEIPADKLVQPEDLAKQLQGDHKPTVVCVGPRALYNGAHIPGALYHGPASTPDGLSDLLAWAKSAPKDSHVVIYCGCCPFERCPNVRPAFKALSEMGFTNLKVLALPNNFHTDWTAKGFPVDTGK